MSRVIKAAIWKEKPWLVEVPPPQPPVPVSEPDAVTEKKDNKKLSKGELDYAAFVNMKVEAEKKKVEAENLLAAVRQEKEELFTKTNDKIGQMIEDAEKNAASIRQKAEEQAASVCKEADEKTAEAQKKADEIIKQAEETAASIKAAAEEEAKELKENAKQEGHKEGFAEGHKDGIEQALAEQKQAILDANAKAEKTLKDADQEKETYIQQAEKEISDIVFEVAGKILPQHFIDVPQVILPLVQKALQKIKDQPRIVIHVAPAHYDFVLMAKNELQATLEGNGTLEVTSDASLKMGDVFLESPNGDVDARLATQLELVKKAVQDVIV